MKDDFNPMNEAAREPDAPDDAPIKDPPRGKAAVKAYLEEKYTLEQIEQQRIMWELSNIFQQIWPTALEEMQRRTVRAAGLEAVDENNPDYDPTMDPASPAFDFLKWKKQTGINSLDELAALVVFALGNIQVQLEATMLRPDPSSKKAIAAIRELKKIIDSDEFQIVKDLVLSSTKSAEIDTEPEKIECHKPASIIPSHQMSEPAPSLLGYIPSGEMVSLMQRVIAGGKGNRIVQARVNNRHEKILTIQNGSSLHFIRENTQSKTKVEFSIEDSILSKKTGKTFSKLLIFTFQKMTEQNFPSIVSFPLRELIDVGAYKAPSSARRALTGFYQDQKSTSLSGTIKKGNKLISQRNADAIFTGLDITSDYVRLWVNAAINVEFIAPYFTAIPQFAYSLKINAFNLIVYIFYIARQNSKSIKDKGTFNIKLEVVRDTLGLPDVDEVKTSKNRKYRQFIIEPIEKAIEEIEEKIHELSESKKGEFTITPYGTDTTNIQEWLSGYLVIGLTGDFAKDFIMIADNAEMQRARFDRSNLKKNTRIVTTQEASKEQ